MRERVEAGFSPSYHLALISELPRNGEDSHTCTLTSDALKVEGVVEAAER